MDDNLKRFAWRVCDYSIGPKNKRIKGKIHIGNYKFKEFEYTGDRAMQLIKILLKIEETA